MRRAAHSLLILTVSMADQRSTHHHSKDETLLTKKSLELSLSPPRCPPFGTAHHSVLLGTNPLNDPYVSTDHHDDAHSKYNHTTSGNVRERLMYLVYNARHNGIRHPHLSVGPEVGDQVTRFLGTILPLSWQNHCRDSGGFRSIVDNLVTSSISGGVVTNPRAAIRYLKLTQRCQTIHYGSHHESQFIDMFFPEDCSQEEMTGLVFFVHGGAWGSGKPWFYRLVAQPFLDRNLAVAIVGYRVYPDADVHTQVRDLDSAYLELSKRYPDLCGPIRLKRPIGVCVMGHSSGAHVALLMVVEQAKRLLHVEESRLLVDSHQLPSSGATTEPSLLLVDSFVGISGPYDISHHFDYEAARGVEELSPMKAANGYTREQFRLNTPALRVQEFLISFQESSRLALDHFFPKTLLIHGIEDDTVPFTATSESARILRACGLTKCEEFYAPLTGHQDAVMHLMFGGRVQTAVVDWLLDRDSRRQRKMGPLRSKL
jgi:acetyl esterase/lipase